MALQPETARSLQQAAESFGTPAYVYFADQVRDRARSLRSSFDDRFLLSYAVKANPNRAVLALLRDLVDHLDVSSAGELRLAMQAGWPAESCTFVGPGKQQWELEYAVDNGCGVIIVERLDEIEDLSRLALDRGREIDIAIRLNPSELPAGFGVSMSRRATPFGIDEEESRHAVEVARATAGLQLVGLHVYAGTQCLDASAIAENYRNVARLFSELIAEFELSPTNLVFGSGLGIPYHDGAEPLVLDDVVADSTEALDALIGQVGSGVLSLELGRYLVGEAGYYLASVVGTKSSRGSEMAILDGGMNHHLAASGNLGGVIKRNYPVHAISTAGQGESKVDLAGPLCTNIDMLARGAVLPPLSRGDVVAIGSSGAYGVSSSPVHFIGHRPPLELLADGESITDVTADGVIARPAWADSPSLHQ